MYDKQELCNKIKEIYPDIGECGIDVTVHHDGQAHSWIVDLKKGGHELKHHLDYPDANDCMDGKQCVALGLEIAQLRKNIEGRQF